MQGYIQNVALKPESYNSLTIESSIRNTRFKTNSSLSVVGTSFFFGIW